VKPEQHSAPCMCYTSTRGINYFTDKALECRRAGSGGVFWDFYHRNLLSGFFDVAVQELAVVRRKNAAATAVAAQREREAELQQRYKDLMAQRSDVRAKASVAPPAAEVIAVS